MTGPVIQELLAKSRGSLPLNLPPGALSPDSINTFGATENSVLVIGGDGRPEFITLVALKARLDAL
jgi:hypothetical protein